MTPSLGEQAAEKIRNVTVLTKYEMNLIARIIDNLDAQRKAELRRIVEQVVRRTAQAECPVELNVETAMREFDDILTVKTFPAEPQHGEQPRNLSGGMESSCPSSKEHQQPKTPNARVIKDESPRNRNQRPPELKQDSTHSGISNPPAQTSGEQPREEGK